MNLPFSESQRLITFSAADIQAFAHEYAGQLRLRREINLKDCHFNQLLNQRQFTPVQAIKHKRFSHECQRCGNTRRSLFGMINCAHCQNHHSYCRHCIDMGRVMACEPLYYWTGKHPTYPKVAEPCIWDGQLTANQKIGSDRILEMIKSEHEELLVWGVCGAGKTEMLFSGIAMALSLNKRICIATPRADVVRELLPRFEKFFPNVLIEGRYGGRKNRSRSFQLMIATTHQLYRFKNAFDVMIVDEVDAFPYHADPALPFVTNRAKKTDGTVIYLTATPRKKQKIDIHHNLLQHIFIPTRYHGYPLPVPTLKMCFFLQKDLKNGKPPNVFLDWFKQRKNKERQLLIFVPTIHLATVLSRRLKEKLPQQSIFSVHAEDEKREDKIHAFRNKLHTILITTTILERGVTFPSIDVIVLDAGHIVFDEAALVQMAGRAGRSADDPTGEVIFYHDGKTDAIVQAVYEIKSMNKRGGF